MELTKRQKSNQRAKEWHRKQRKLNPVGYGRKVKLAKLKCYYGIDELDFELLFSVQNGACAICRGQNNSGRALCVDHCHKTGQVRGLLCGACNAKLGYWQDDILLMQRACEYLQKGWRVCR